MRISRKSFNALGRVFSFAIEEKAINPIKSYELTKRKKRKLKSSEVETEADEHAQKLAFLQYLNQAFVKTINAYFANLSSEDRLLRISALNNLLLLETKFTHSSHNDISPHKNVIFSWVVGLLLNQANLTTSTAAFIKDTYVSKDFILSCYLMENLEKLIKRKVQKAFTDTDLDFYGTTFNHIKTEKIEWIGDNDIFCRNAFILLSIVDMKLMKKNFDELNSKTPKPMEMGDSEDFDDDLDSESEERQQGSDEESKEEEEEPEDEKSASEEESVDDTPQDDFQRLRRSFSAAWLEFLLLELPTRLYKSVLEVINDKIIPYMIKPILLYEFLSDSYSIGGAISILALDGLFTLIRKHNVDYPDFYEKLYALFTPELFYMKQRSKFFQQAYMFLKTSRLPSSTVCSFIKRLSRLSLTAPPQGCLVIVALIYNLLLKHPSAIVLIHRNKKVEAKPNENSKFPLLLTKENTVELLETDPFNNLETNPTKTNAMESSLWELKTLTNHYVPWVSDIANSIFAAQELKKAEFDLAEFSSLSYSQIFQTEYKRKNKNTSLAIQDPSSFFDCNNYQNFAI